MNFSSKNIPFYALAVTLFLFFKLLYISANAENILFLLSPTNMFISMFSNSTGVFIKNAGYYHQDLNILIEKSCAGFNFFILSFILSYTLSLQYTNKWKTKLILLPACLLISWLLTIGVNVARISTAILFNAHLLSNSAKSATMHEIQGTFIYLFFLLLFYKILKYALTKYYTKYEKFA